MVGVETIIIILLVSLVAGIFGAILGLGGGVIVIPSLALVLDVPIHVAIAASIVAVIATSSAAATSYVEHGITSTRLAMLLETTTTTGALVGALIATSVKASLLEAVLGVVLVYAAISMFARGREDGASSPAGDALADRLRLNGSYMDPLERRIVNYRVTSVKTGVLASFFAGGASGLLGIGGGAIKVPIMNLLMGVPIRVAAATSNFMIGVTAVAGATVYFLRGYVDPSITGPVALGVLAGARLGSKMSEHIKAARIRQAFVLVLLYIAVRMIARGLGIPLMLG